MTLRSLSRPGSIAALAVIGGAFCLAIGLFLAVGRDSVAGEGVKVWTSDEGPGKVKVIRIGDDEPDTGETHGFLGVDVDEYTKSDEGGAIVNRVVDDSPAAKGGLKQGDVIVGFNGSVIRGPAKLTEEIHATKAGDKVTVEVRRDGKLENLQVEMAERPQWSWSWNGKDFPGLDKEQEKALEESLKGLEKQKIEMGKNFGKMRILGPKGNRIFFSMGDKPLLGVELVETTPDLREAMGGTKDSGVLIGRVMSGSAAEKAGVKVGDLILSVDGDVVADPGDLAEAIRDKAGKSVDLEIVRDKRSMHVKAAIPEIKKEEAPDGPSAGIWVVPTPAAAPLAPLPPVVAAHLCAPAPSAPAAATPSVAPAPRALPAPRAAPAPPAPPAPPAAPAPTAARRVAVLV